MQTKVRKEVRHAGEQELIGVFAWAKFRSPTGDFVIGKLSDGQTVVGNPGDTTLEQGCTYRFFGRHGDHPSFGPQFKFSCVIQDTPLNEDGIVKYLVDNVKGVGYIKARQLFEKFKDKAVDVLSDNPESTVGILTSEQAKEASTLLRSMVATRQTTIELLSLFNKRGFPKRLVQAAIYRWGVKAASIIKENPFELIAEKIKGCGFKNVDKLYLDLGHNPSAPQRQMFCVWHALKSDTSGHTWFPVRKAFSAVQEMISGAECEPAVAIRTGVEEGWLSLWSNKSLIEKKKGFVTERRKAQEESLLAKEIKRLLASTVVIWPKELPGLSEHQNEQVAKSCSQQIAILVGTPGTGKTFAAAAIIRSIIDAYGMSSVAACAPTGKASVRLTHSMQKLGIPIKASTIHSLLKYAPNDDGDMDFEFNSGKKLPQQFFIMDESSMCGTALMAKFLCSLPGNAHVLIIGDKYQLPPVDHGAPLRDMLKFMSSVGELTEIWRNSGDIVKSCAAMKDGKPLLYCDKFSDKKGNNLRLIRATTPDEQIEYLQDFMKACIQKNVDPINQVQVITPLNAKSPVSRKVLNPLLQSLLNPNGYSIKSNKYRVGDKIICLKNSNLWRVDPRNLTSADATDYRVLKDEDNKPLEVRVFNGEIGIVRAIAEGKVIADFPFPQRIVQCNLFAPKDDEEPESEQFDLAYAVTGHKMQGSQQRYIVAMIDSYPGARMICSREYWYTTISRAEYRTLMIGDPAVVARQCQWVSIEERRTFLVRRMER